MVVVKGYDKIKKFFETQEKGAEKAIETTEKDMKKSMPGWIASEVVKEYNIGKQQITSQKIGTIRTYGSKTGASIKFEGRVLTPTHFGMKPKNPPTPKKLSKKARMIVPGNNINFSGPGSKVATIGRAVKPYEVSWEIKRGERKKARGKYETPWFVASSNGSTPLPFQRSPGHPKNWKTVTAYTLSMPQMISHDGVTLKPEIAEEVWPKMEKRFKQNVKRFMT